MAVVPPDTGIRRDMEGGPSGAMPTLQLHSQIAGRPGTIIPEKAVR